MRRILIENARRKRRRKRGGEGLERVDMTTSTLRFCRRRHLAAVDEALGETGADAPDRAQLVKLRFFAGLPNVEAARLLGFPERTANRHWAFARAWLL